MSNQKPNREYANPARNAVLKNVLDAQVSLIRSNSTLINTVHDARIQEMNLSAILGILDLKYLTEEE